MVELKLESEKENLGKNENKWDENSGDIWMNSEVAVKRIPNWF